MSTAPRLVVVTDLRIADETRTLAVVAAVLDAVPPALVAVGLRDHDASPRRRLVFGRSLVALARPRGARVLVHDRLDLARAIDADGVQLGVRSVDVADARAILPKGSIVAKSCHDESELARAFEDGVDWATLSPLFASPQKTAPLGLARFSEIRSRVPEIVVLALGGVDASNAPLARRAGADGVAAIRAILAAADPVAVARAMVVR